MWKLLVELELWLLDLQLGAFQLPAVWIVAFIVVGILIVYLVLRIVIWRQRVGFASQLLGSASFIFPPPVVRLKVVVGGALIVAALWFSWNLLR